MYITDKDTQMCVQIGDVVSKTQQSAIKKRYQ